LPRKCVEWHQTLTNDDPLQQLEVMENPCHQEQGYTPLFFLLSGSRFLCNNSNLIIDTYVYCQSDNNLAKISWHYTFNVKIINPKEYTSKWPLQGLLSLLRTQKFVRQKTGAGGYFCLCPNSWHSPFKQGNLNKKSRNGRIITLSGLLSCTIFLFIIGPLLLKFFSSFPSLQDVKTVLYNAFNIWQTFFIQ